MYIEKELNRTSVGRRELVAIQTNKINAINAFHGCREPGTTRPKTDFHVAFSANNSRGETRFESGTYAGFYDHGLSARTVQPLCDFASRCYFTWLVRCDTRHPKTNALRFLGAVPRGIHNRARRSKHVAIILYKVTADHV